ncbi:unnamed protein product [Aspergillus oryzae]|nr:unnamed protein product [Aspergillus oryzae]
MDDKPAIELAECVEAGTKSRGNLLVDADGQVQRLPVPSKDPNDPLNYSTWEKTAIIVSCCWFCEFFVLWTSLPPDFGKLTNILTSYHVLVLHWGPWGNSQRVLPVVSASRIYYQPSRLVIDIPVLVCRNCLGWRWFYWVFAIAVAIGLVLVVFGGFETGYKRRSQFVNGRMVITDRFGVTRMLTEDETREVLESQGHPSSGEEIPEELRPKKTYWQMLKPWSHPTESALTFIPQILFQIVEALLCPGILYATLLSSVVLASSIGMSLSYNTVLEYNYHWAPESIGLINLGGVFGGFGGMLYAGFLGDKFIVWKATRNGGAFVPEHRLILLIFPGVLGVAALLLYGFTADGGATWGGPYMGWTLFQITFVSVLILSTSFAAESWERNPGPALVAVVGMKNIVAFGLSYGINPMVEKYSYPTAMGILAAVTGGVFLLGIPVYILNPRVSTNVGI